MIRAWLLPLIVLALVLPGSAAFVLAGPGFGLAAGALSAAAVVVYAARRQPHEPIEAVSAGDGRRRVLVVAGSAIDDPRAVEELARGRQDAELLVLAPATNRLISHWLSDVGPARVGAQERLAVSLVSLAAARLDAHGQVGDPDVVQSVEDTLAVFPADEVVLAIGPGQAEGEVTAEIRKRLRLPLHLLFVDRPSDS